MELVPNQSNRLLRSVSSLDGMLDRVNGVKQNSNYRTGTLLPSITNINIHIIANRSSQILPTLLLLQLCQS